MRPDQTSLRILELYEVLGIGDTKNSLETRSKNIKYLKHKS